MNGIFGLIALDSGSVPPEEEATGILRQMAESMCHEPWYVAQTYSCRDLRVWAGHVSATTAASRTGDVRRYPPILSIVAGEGWAVRRAGGEPRDGLENAAAEVVRAYTRDGLPGLAELDSNVSGLVIDRRNDRCVLFADRFGRERLFVHLDGERLLFASEAKAILRVSDHTRSFDRTGLAELFVVGCTLGTRSLFNRVEVLAGGTALSVARSGGVRRLRYFEPSTWQRCERMREEEFVEGFSQRLSRAARACLAGPPAAISLTGGIDSRMVMATLDARPSSVPCYTFGSMYRRTRDVDVATKVAAVCGQSHHVLELGREFLSDAPSLLRRSVYISDGYLGLSGAAELYLNRLARRIAPARITGNWGGELTRGVRAFKATCSRGGFFASSMTGHLDEARDEFADAQKSEALEFTLYKQIPFQGYGRYAIERSQLRMLTPFLAAEVVKWLCQAPREVLESGGWCASVIAKRPELLAIPTDTGPLSTEHRSRRRLRRLPARALAKAEYLTGHGAPNWLAFALGTLPGGAGIERSFLGRDKFQHYRLWLRTELAPLLSDALLDTTWCDAEELFDKRRVASMVGAQLKGRANYTDEIDKLMTVRYARETLLSPCFRTNHVKEIAHETLS